MEYKLLSISEIKEDAELYPRHINDEKNWCDWHTVYKYSQALKAGAKFPVILVARFAGSYYLVDGKHRIEMYKQNKVESVQVEVMKAKTREQIFIEAIKRNSEHGSPLSAYDKTIIIQKLRKMDVSDIRISEIVRIPLGNLNSFFIKRITNSVTGEEIALKAPLHYLSGSVVPVGVGDMQRVFASASQEQIFNQVIVLLETNTINLKSPVILNKLKIIRKLISQMILSRRKK